MRYILPPYTTVNQSVIVLSSSQSNCIILKTKSRSVVTVNTNCLTARFLFGPVHKRQDCSFIGIVLLSLSA